MAQLVNKGGALFNQTDFIPTEEPQFFDQWLLWPECFPVLAIHPQGVGKTPSIQSIAFDPAGGFAFPVGLRALGIERINQHARFHELLDRHSLTGLDRKRNRAVRLKFLPELFPT